jgi:hypothetical protein
LESVISIGSIGRRGDCSSAQHSQPGAANALTVYTVYNLTLFISDYQTSKSIHRQSSVYFNAHAYALAGAIHLASADETCPERQVVVQPDRPHTTPGTESTESNQDAGSASCCHSFPIIHSQKRLPAMSYTRITDVMSIPLSGSDSIRPGSSLKIPRVVNIQTDKRARVYLSPWHRSTCSCMPFVLGNCVGEASSKADTEDQRRV